MSYERPTFAELQARIDVDLSAVPASLRGPLVAAWARACHGQHGYLDWIAAQASPLTCELEMLSTWGALYGVTRLEAVPAEGAILATGTTGAVVLAGDSFSGPNGLAYAVTEAATITATGARVLVRCQVAGEAGNLSVGQVLTATNPIAGVTGSATVMVGGISGGAELESLDDWRIRVADEWATVVADGGRSGGRAADYRWWAKSAHPSVTGALVQPGALGLGTVLVRPICNALPSRLPTDTVLTDVRDYIAMRAPAGADVRVASPIATPVPIALDLSPVVDSAPTRPAIESALAAAIFANSAEASVLTLAELDAAVATVTSQYERLAPTADIALGPGEIFGLPSLTWV